MNNNIKDNKDFEKIINIINTNSYCIEFFSNTKKDPNSLSYLIDRKLSQSDNIKLGIAIEKVFKDIIVNFSNLINIRKSNRKGVKEKDHLFMDIKNKIIYYAEIKGNLNLDTEKSKSTYLKVLDIDENLTNQYTKYTIKSFLVGARYVVKNDIPKKILLKYKNIEVLGINDYFENLHLNLNFDNKTYRKMLNLIAEKCFN